MFWAIGDVHGNVPSYESICQRLRKEDPNAITFQVGDMGLGFRGVNMPQGLGPNDYFIAGNHDDSMICAISPNYLGDFGCREIGGKKVFWLSGAMSTDKAHRTEGVDWWAWEELTMEQLTQAVALYEAEAPELVITHDCPADVRQQLFGYREGGRTVQALSMMFKLHQPEFWCFGHHHKYRCELINGTYFYCLEELQNKKIQRPKAVWEAED